MTRIQRQSQKKSSLKNKIKVLIIVCFLLISGFVLRDSFAVITHTILVPTKQTFEFIKRPFSTVGNYFKFKNNLVKENHELSQKNKRLEVDIISMKGIIDQNKHFKNLLNIYSETEEQKIVATVISLPPLSPFDTFVANFKSVNEDNLVGKKIYYMNILIGEVKEVYSNNLIGKLYSSSGEKINVKINNESSAEAIGLGGLSFKIDVPKNVEIEKGMPIFPVEHRDRIIGIVDEIKTKEESSFQTIFFTFPFVFSDLTHVEIKI